MIHAASFALIDSVNVLLIGVVVALGLIIPPHGPYRKTVALLIGGDWFGVFLLALLSLLVFNNLGGLVISFTESVAFGIVIILAGILIAVLTALGGSNDALIQRILVPLKNPGILTVLTGTILGLAQSITSAPFFLGLIELSATPLAPTWKYSWVILYATLALSLPMLSAVLVGIVRRYPNSVAGHFFDWMRQRPQAMTLFAGYGVGILLIVMGVVELLT
ncbi:hypothetical protein GP475_04035 [Corynebacterium poyangense]|uniref:Uncharacterized protein n=1 Tax=Corynebacterium poyangense TaxID=2684405 RepID=A0A7H0SMY3_9CORY|nr:hypothetical protein [Corynebacterium poyangense]MBZ8176259.1 hypothetical protein [Corynebacterium poyangense]QNQ89908.1 hypothetical protein GP475_04035 [Corynebacterium poyangense]